MRAFRKSTSFAADIALFAVLAQLWLALSCCVAPTGGMHPVFGADAWCSIDRTDTSTPTEHKAHACDCVMAASPLAPTPSVAIIHLLDAQNQDTSVLVSSRIPVRLTLSGTLGSRAPPHLL